MVGAGWRGQPGRAPPLIAPPPFTLGHPMPAGQTPASRPELHVDLAPAPSRAPTQLMLTMQQSLEARIASQRLEGRVDPKPGQRQVIRHLQQRLEAVQRLLGLTHQSKSSTSSFWISVPPVRPCNRQQFGCQPPSRSPRLFARDRRAQGPGTCSHSSFGAIMSRASYAIRADRHTLEPCRAPRK